MTTPDSQADKSVFPLRRKRLAAFVAFGGAGIAVLYPDTLEALVAFVVAIFALLFWPSEKTQNLGRRSEARPEADRLDAGAEAVVEALAEPVLVINRDLTLTYQNPASLGPLGRLQASEPIHLRFRAPHVLSAIEDAVGTGRRTSALLEERRGADRSFEIEVLPVPVRDGGNPSIFLIVFYDRTVARQTERIRTDFVANASHELRTPLASLTGFIETLQGPAQNDAVAREKFLAIMRDQAGRMSRLIDDLLSLSRIEMKRHLPVSQPVELGAILRKVADQLSPLANDMGLSIETDLGIDPVLVAGEPDELMQVFSNLVENACKYGRDGERVVLRLTTGEERGRPIADASVVDFGPGVAAEHVPRLTERFYRVDVGNSRAMKGTGLGLAIVRNILLRHKARLMIESQVGAGSTFTARFQRLSDRSQTSLKNN
ncbi:ATP-binding region, ATPase-like:Histidine kinase A, N-terminal:Bacterial sensor protein [Fulvimarina pelagi HTCC2506]|uniref:histidine kinase n=1 Tax=Fulvimarina pelagi HTCC2506 TaxID=314231 RepID=Q0G1X8_9HYPH|nr:ATP-binding protein [Fulvimarina pelagi]EAU41420.1 ATP-binding region, ATPase-like:Histidine kinase A, N-terminal:Bacterial sensor protein [Fulvimarina pelagi HTCC2506]